MTAAGKANGKYKDSLFRFLFGREENRAWTLSLYNAVNDSAYTDAGGIVMTTIQDVLFLGMRNDVSFLISSWMNLYEHQSTYNPNMPLRQLQYAAGLYEKYLKDHKLNKFGSRQLQLPIPKLVTFYNGRTAQPEESLQRLSDSFPAWAHADIDVKVRVININYSSGAEILKKCRPLREYAWFVDQVRAGQDACRPLKEAIEQAILDLPADYEIKPFLEKHLAEVKGMFVIDDYTEEEIRELFREDAKREGREQGLREGREEGLREGWQEGLKEGRQEGVMSTLIDLVQGGILTVSQAAKQADMTETEFQRYVG